MRDQFPDVAIAKNNFFAKCNECISIQNKLKGTTDPDEEKELRETQVAHYKYLTSCRQVYYSHRLASHTNPNSYVSIVHDKMDKSKTSIPRMGKRAKVFSNVMNLPISLTSMLTYGHKTGGYGHFSLSFLEMGSNFTVTSLAKCLRSLEEPVVDQHGDFLYKSGTSQHPLHDALLQSTSYENCVNYKQDRLQDYTNLCMPKKNCHPYYCCKWIIVQAITKTALSLHSYLF